MTKSRHKSERFAHIPERKKPNKKTGQSILIVVEGHSEEKYFNALKERWRLSSVFVVDNPECTDPINLLKEGVEQFKKRIEDVKKGNFKVPYDEIWIVYDLETPVDERRILSMAAQNKAKKYEEEYERKHKENKLKIYFAISDPTFEFWYILHFKKTTKDFNDAEEAETYLKRYWENYKKNSKPISDVLDRTETAITNAEWVRNEMKSEKPKTDVDLIVSKIKPDTK